MHRIIIYTSLAFTLALLGSIAWIDLSLHQDELRWIETAGQTERNNMRADYYQKRLDEKAKGGIITRQ